MPGPGLAPPPSTLRRRRAAGAGRGSARRGAAPWCTAAAASRTAAAGTRGAAGRSGSGGDGPARLDSHSIAARFRNGGIRMSTQLTEALLANGFPNGVARGVGRQLQNNQTSKGQGFNLIHSNHYCLTCNSLMASPNHCLPTGGCVKICNAKKIIKKAFLPLKDLNFWFLFFYAAPCGTLKLHCLQ